MPQDSKTYISYFLILISCLFALCCKKDDAVNNESREHEVREIFTVVEEMPRFPGCEHLEISNSEKIECSKEKMNDFIYGQLIYPSDALANNIEGTVVIRFIVSTDGSIQEANILKEIGYGTGEEGLRIINAMPDFEPGKQRGEPVEVYFNVPITFEL